MEEARAEEDVVLPHHRAASKPRQEGFEPDEENAKEFAISSSEHKSGSLAVHRESRNRASKKETQTGVRKYYFFPKRFLM